MKTHLIFPLLFGLIVSLVVSDATPAFARSQRASASCELRVTKMHQVQLLKCSRLANKKKRSACYKKASKAKAAGLAKCARSARLY